MKTAIALLPLPLISTLLLTSCVGVQNAPSTHHALVSRPPDPGKAKIFVYRPSRFLSGGVAFPVFVDGRMLGSNASGTFLVTEIEGGHHTVTAGQHQHALNAQPGESYYYNQTVAWKWVDPSTATDLEKVSESEGRHGVSQCKQAPNAF